jgi:hypothetical protein
MLSEPFDSTKGIRQGVLSLGSLVKALLEGEDKRRAVTSFCEDVISQKEEAERIRRGEVILPALRRGRRGGQPQGGRRGGRRLRAHNRALPV